MTSMKVALVALLMCSSFALAGPVVGPTGPKDDFANPKAAAASFFNAMVAGDEAATKNATLGTKEQQDMIGPMIQMMQASRKLSDAAKAKFGEADVLAAFGPEVANGQENMNKEITKLMDADETIEGTTATLTPKAEAASQPASQPASRPSTPMKLQKIDGKWKVDLASMQAGGTPTPEQLKMYQTMAKNIEQTAVEIAAGKYKTAVDARQGMVMSLMAAVQAERGAATSRPAGEPGAPAAATSAPATE